MPRCMLGARAAVVRRPLRLSRRTRTGGSAGTALLLHFLDRLPENVSQRAGEREDEQLSWPDLICCGS